MSSLENTNTVDVAPVTEAAAPTLLDRVAFRLVREVLKRLERGRATLTLPDGTVERFGRAGTGPDARIEGHRWRAFRRLLRGGDTGAAEAFMDGDWDAEDLVSVVSLFVANAELFDRDTPFNRLSDLLNRALHALRRNSRAGSRRNVAAHYDLGNGFYELFLDPGMTYSCALFEDGKEPLEKAQERKLRRVAELARLAPAQTVLEIGCGWGSFAEIAARDFGCRVVGLTLSTEQAAFARARLARAGLSDRVEIRLADYRTLLSSGERFDRLVSIEMLEAVGHDYLPRFFETCDAALGPGGIGVVQSITIPDARHDRLLRRPDFIKKHIFPGSHLPSIGSITAALSRTRLFVDHLEEIGPHYAETLRRWRVRFLENRGRANALGFSESFLRMWEYYFAYCEGAFVSRFVNDVQLVLTREGNQALGPAPAYGGGS